jgi:hypothetical protein
VLWCFLSLPTDAFGAFLKDPNRRAITVHLLHLLISLALPCPTASVRWPFLPLAIASDAFVQSNCLNVDVNACSGRTSQAGEQRSKALRSW